MTFTQDSKDLLYKCTNQSVTKDFNIHLETDGEKADRIDVYVASATSATKKQCIYSKYFTGVFDHDFEAKVYPKTIDIVCTSNPTLSALT